LPDVRRSDASRSAGRACDDSRRISDGDDRITVLFMQTQTYLGADSRIHASIAQHLDPDRVRVIVACNTGAGAGSPALDEFSRIRGIEVIPMDFGASRDEGGLVGRVMSTVKRLPLAWRLTRLAWFARRNGVDVVHGTEKPRDVIFGYIVGRMAGAKTLTHLHVKVEAWINPVTRWLMRRNDALVGVSEFVVQSAIDLGYRPDRLYSVLNALEVDRWDPERVDAALVRDEFGVDDDVVLIAVIARVFPWKGHERLIRALALIRNEVPPFRLLVAGDDDPRATPDGRSYTSVLREIVEELDLGANVTFTGFRKDVPALMKAIDIFAMPSHEEPFGMVFLEGLAMRTPVVAMRSGGVPEFIEHGVTGLLSDDGDLDGLAQNLATLMLDPNLRARIGENGRTLVLSRFASPRMAADVEVVYRRVLGRQVA
jgi:glycosyltransferase involved in cell wall biosynthesis